MQELKPLQNKETSTLRALPQTQQPIKSQVTQTSNNQRKTQTYKQQNMQTYKQTEHITTQLYGQTLSQSQTITLGQRTQRNPKTIITQK